MSPFVEKAKVLRKYKINDGHFLGRGMEAEVYSYGKDKVFKLYNHMSSFKKQELLKRFYASIDSSAVSYAFPYVYDMYKEGDIVVTIEKRIQGGNMQRLLPKLSFDEMTAIMESSLDAQLEMRSVKLSPKFEGYQLFHDDPNHAEEKKDWHGFLKQYLLKKQNEVEKFLSKDVVNYKEKLTVLHTLLSSEYQGDYTLIHGDYYPGNLLIDGEGKITGLIDFGLMTMVGDYLFDVAIGWVLFDMYDELKANVLDRYLQIIVTTLGEEVREKLYFYVLLYSVFSANVYSRDCNDGHYQWCVRNLNNRIYWE
ncbi:MULTISPECIES: aminoglycoside phosphotransferase family protein [Metabacillus]|uniref:Aminoglycoside phosphotransferase domain-containing protein n=2 Tax=Metabacillus TaxID=2675233 RepID=A0A179T1D2_9BACI|nr:MULTISPECIES: aminoglycoside phosphotransferase family protein [Metabacillus]OAS87797.1 hypothetical protein A6K24_18845 [Metabacillus litoralis]QNF27297.1 phosphotransferase [Metabacillus sp. KUDC1714]